MCTLCIYGKCDDVIEIVMKKLKMAFPVWQRKMRLRLTATAKNVELTGVDGNGAPYEIFKKIEVTGLSKSASAFPSNLQKLQPFKA